MIGFLGAAMVIRPSAYTQTYSTVSKTVPNATAAWAVDTNGTAGFLTAADRTAVITTINAVMNDILSIKKVVGQIIDDMQSLGLVA